MSERPEADAVAAALLAVARRLEAAARLEPSGNEAILQSVVDATAAVFTAEAASLALYDAGSERLVFRVAAGERGQGVIGLSLATDDGVAGYVFTTGQPLAIADVAADPRFQRGAAAQTGYVPRSLLAVPLIDDDGVLGVLEVLDRTDGATFSLQDIEAAMVFARQACIAIRSTRLERTGAYLLGAALVAVASADRDGLDDDAIDTLVAAATASVSSEDDAVWRIADALARLRTVDPDDADLVIEFLEALERRGAKRAAARGVTR